MTDFIALEQQYGARNYAPLPVVIARGQGSYLWDTDGKQYLDMMSAYSAVSHGHLHPRLVAVAKRQLEQVAVISRAFYSDQLGPMLQKLCTMSGMDKALPMNSGAEAVETAIKAARRYAAFKRGVPDGQQEIIVARHNFHGRTSTIVGFSSEPSYKKGFGPFAPGFIEVPFGDAAALEAAITPHTAAVLIEPIQGEAGIIVPPDGYLAAVRAICSKHQVLFILDEIQSGLGRTGKLFAFEHENAKPDGLIVGKALGGGMLPVSAFLARADIMDLFEPGSHGSTFGGNPLAAAVAYEGLCVLEEEGLVQRSHDLGLRMKAAVAAISHPAIKDVRGRGLWLGVEIDAAAASGRDVCLAMMKRGVLAKETHGTVVRLAPPLVIEAADVDHGVAVFAEALNEVVK